MTNNYNKSSIREVFETKIKSLNVVAWEHRINGKLVNEWVAQFETSDELHKDEQIHALFLLSHFMYFGQSELRSLLKSMYRDMIRSPNLQDIRRENSNTSDISLLKNKYKVRLEKMRFVGVGEPSDSGAFLLYYFRQENSLPRNLFINNNDILNDEVPGTTRIKNLDIEQYIFIDDFCGSGSQAEDYLFDIVDCLKSISTIVKVSYLVLFATSAGLKTVRDLNCFDVVDAVFELDDTFKALESNSRIFSGEDENFDRKEIFNTCKKYGKRILPQHPLGYKNGQMLIGFNHNTPNNTLPIFWGDSQGKMGPWKSVFTRHQRIHSL